MDTKKVPQNVDNTAPPKYILYEGRYYKRMSPAKEKELRALADEVAQFTNPVDVCTHHHYP